MEAKPLKPMNPEQWLAACAELSRPLAVQVREWIRTWEPGLEEVMRWDSLCYSGRKLVCGLNGGKKHLGITFFRGGELPDPVGLLEGIPGAVAVRTCRVPTLEGFDVEALRALLRAAVELDGNEEVPPAPRSKRAGVPMPEDLAAALKKNPKAATAFDRLSPTCQREYNLWVSSAVKPETRSRRVAETLIAVAAGKVWSRRKEVLGPKGGG